ncbi:long-chain fatty acid--CoA ligase [Novosphingobium sp.]|uniref:acyl-CoA synthetase n=1 Tax=Novosphingobium sp. TaxID=1874826 RepID=UPI002732A1FD|nr:long-chain fatty acid--CoA ligase [Novosphingobium sp.]MDP3908605.1 long-chain fatty acid--CoA ligase [Novosphingobium sp.]
MHLTQGLHRSARIRSDAIATIDGSRQRTWAEVARDVARFAGLIRSLGVADGDRVAVLAHNSDQYFDAYFAVVWAGAIIVPLNTRLAVPELAYQLHDVGAKVLFHGDGFGEHGAALAAEFPALTVIALAEQDGSLRQRIAAQSATGDAARGDADVAGIFYTGGTTGLPKGVMLTHRNLVSVATNLIAIIPFDAACINLHCAPMFHLADIGLFTVTMVGGTHVFTPRPDAATIIALVARHRVTHAFTVPSVIDALSRADLAAHDLGSLQMLGYGGSPMPAATLERVQARMPAVDFIQGFGMTEMPSLTALLPADHRPGADAARLRSVGVPAYGFEAKVVGPDDREVPRGQIGEIVGRGPCVMAGYWGKPAETAEALRGGWMHSQDAGYMDAGGYLFITDRLKDMIVSGAENIYSTEVENALNLHPAVRESAAIGVPDERWVERVHAILVLEDGAVFDEEALRRHLEARIARYKWPKSWEVRSEPLPRSAIGKILKTDLRAPHWQGHGRKV